MLKADLPLAVFDLPLFKSLRECITDMLWLDNVRRSYLSALIALLCSHAATQDLLSYRKERAAGDDMHSIITLVMKEKRLNLHAAIAWLAAEHAKRVDEFFVLWPEASALTFGSDTVNRAVECYMDHLRNWPRGHQCWPFECERFFGMEGLKVKTERVVELTAKMPERSCSSSCCASAQCSAPIEWPIGE